MIRKYNDVKMINDGFGYWFIYSGIYYMAMQLYFGLAGDLHLLDTFHLMST